MVVKVMPLLKNGESYFMVSDGRSMKVPDGYTKAGRCFFGKDKGYERDKPLKIC